MSKSRNLLCAVGLMAAQPVSAATDTDFPHRDWGKIASLDMPFDEAQACIARELDKTGSVLVLPVDSGSDIDFSIGGSILTPNTGEPYLRFKLRRIEHEITLRAYYRRPLSLKGLNGTVEALGRKCLKIARIETIDQH